MKKTFILNSISKSFIVAVFIIATSFCKSGASYSQGWVWAKSQGGLNNDAGRAVCTDPSGNVIVAGGFFAPSVQIGTVTINSLGGGDIYLAKFDPSGNVIWVQTIGGTGLDVVGGVCTSTNGDIYISGSYDSPTLTISTYNLPQASTVGNMDIFIAKYNSSGAALWASKFGTTGNERATGITYSNALGNLLLTGYFASATFTLGAYTITNSNNSGFSYDAFFAKFNPTFGTATGAFSLGGVNADDYGYTVRADASNYYLGGSFSPVTGSVSSIGIPVTSYGSQDVYITKFSNTNVFQWVRTGGSSSTSADYFTGMDIDASSNIYLSGAYNAQPMVIGTATLANSGSNDAFIAKYNTSGVFQWANKVGGTGSDFGYDVAVDGNNNPYLTGYFGGTTLTVGSFSLTNTAPGSSDIFVAKYNSTGTPQWVSTSTSIGTESPYGMTADALGNVYVVGSYNIGGPLAFGTTTLNSAGNNDAFLAKIGCLTATIAGTTTICSGSSTTLTASGATNYTWSTGATTPSIVISPSVTSTYTIIGNTGSCTVSNSNAYTVSVLPASINAGPDYSLTCGQKQLISAVTIPTSPSSVVWTPTTGLSNPAILTPTATAGSTLNQYTVTATLSNGCVVKDYVNVSSFATTPQLCMVTVDSLSTNNEVYWDKTMYTKIDSFIVYRETSTNIFKRIAALGKNALSMYVDTARSIGPNNGNPNLASYKYKLQLRDSCGNYSVLSPWHQTIFIQDQQNGNFNWTPYAIEGTTVTPVSNYVLKRRDLASSVETTVSATSGNLTSDPNYSSYSTTNVKWFVDAQGFNCTPTFKTNGTLVTKLKTKSNQSNEKTFPTLGVHENGLNTYEVNIYPNPTRGIVNIETQFLAGTIYTIEVQNLLGETIFSLNHKTNEKVNRQVDLSCLANGVYLIKITQEDKTISVNRIIVNR